MQALKHFVYKLYIQVYMQTPKDAKQLYTVNRGNFDRFWHIFVYRNSVVTLTSCFLGLKYVENITKEVKTDFWV